MFEITRTTLISEALSGKNAPAVADVFMDFGMHCFGCALAKGETVGEGAEGHEIVNVEEMLEALNKAYNG